MCGNEETITILYGDQNASHTCVLYAQFCGRRQTVVFDEVILWQGLTLIMYVSFKIVHVRVFFFLYGKILARDRGQKYLFDCVISILLQHFTFFSSNND